MSEQSAHAVGAHFGRRMPPAKGAHARKMGWQDVLEKTAHPIHGVQIDGFDLASFAVAVRPADLAVGQELNDAIGGGGLEDVAREVAQRVASGTRVLAADVPGLFPDFFGHLNE